MKTLKIAIAAFALAVAITSCSLFTDPEDSSSNVENALSAFVNHDPASTDTNGVFFNELDPMGGLLADENGQFCGGTGRDKSFRGGGKHRGGRGHGGMHDGGLAKSFDRPRTRFDTLQLVVPCLKLDTIQGTEFQRIMQVSRAKADSVYKAIRELQKPLRESAQTQARTIWESLKAGSITRDEAKTQFKSIMDALKTALQPARDDGKTQIEQLQLETLTSIRTILSSEQQTLWDKWMSSGLLPC